jgi:Arc/MetJ family transcription regulator
MEISRDEMQVEIDIDDKLLQRAMEAIGTVSMAHAIEEGLRLLIQRKHIDQILELEGQAPWSGSIEEMRRDD